MTNPGSGVGALAAIQQRLQAVARALDQACEANGSGWAAASEVAEYVPEGQPRVGDTERDLEYLVQLKAVESRGDGVTLPFCYRLKRNDR